MFGDIVLQPNHGIGVPIPTASSVVLYIYCSTCLGPDYLIIYAEYEHAVVVLVCTSFLLPCFATSVALTSTLQRLMPSIGNGFVATYPVVGTECGVHAAYSGNSVYMAGVYNGSLSATWVEKYEWM